VDKGDYTAHTNGMKPKEKNMEYTIEIEENERTLEFALDVECNYWNIEYTGAYVRRS